MSINTINEYIKSTKFDTRDTLFEYISSIDVCHPDGDSSYARIEKYALFFNELNNILHTDDIHGQVDNMCVYVEFIGTEYGYLVEENDLHNHAMKCLMNIIEYVIEHDMEMSSTISNCISSLVSWDAFMMPSLYPLFKSMLAKTDTHFQKLVQTFKNTPQYYMDQKILADCNDVKKMACVQNAIEYIESTNITNFDSQIKAINSMLFDIQLMGIVRESCSAVLSMSKPSILENASKISELFCLLDYIGNTHRDVNMKVSADNVKNMMHNVGGIIYGPDFEKLMELGQGLGLTSNKSFWKHNLSEIHTNITPESIQF